MSSPGSVASWRRSATRRENAINPQQGATAAPIAHVDHTRRSDNTEGAGRRGVHHQRTDQDNHSERSAERGGRRMQHLARNDWGAWHTTPPPPPPSRTAEFGRMVRRRSWPPTHNTHTQHTHTHAHTQHTKLAHLAHREPDAPLPPVVEHHPAERGRIAAPIDQRRERAVHVRRHEERERVPAAGGQRQRENAETRERGNAGGVGGGSKAGHSKRGGSARPRAQLQRARERTRCRQDPLVWFVVRRIARSRAGRRHIAGRRPLLTARALGGTRRPARGRSARLFKHVDNR